jgi:unsaturated rhamnogalacturonyl hydrolase
MNLHRLALSCTLFATALSLSAQQYPKPNSTQQTGIDKDNSRHFGDSPLDPGPLADASPTTALSPALTPAAINAATRKVADWELARAQPTWDQIWTSGVLYAGFMATSSQLNDPKYSNAMLGMANQFHWQLRGRQPNQDENVAHLPGADDQDLAQTYLELYLLSGKKDPSTIAPLRADFDAVIPLQTLRPTDPRIPWWWCDALFMAPPAWVRLYAATGDHKYIDYLNLNWQRASDLLYDKQDHLYARDATFIGKLGPNGTWRHCTHARVPAQRRSPSSFLCPADARDGRRSCGSAGNFRRCCRPLALQPARSQRLPAARKLRFRAHCLRHGLRRE